MYKKEFPIGETIYLDSATRSIHPFLDMNNETFARDYQHGVFKSARNQSKKYLETKKLLADYINGNPDRIALVPNRSVAWNLILSAVADNYTKIDTDWSEDSTLLGPALKSFEVSFTHNMNKDEKQVLMYSSKDPLTGQTKSFEKEKYELTLVDASYDLSYQSVDHYDADIIIAELSIDMLSPFPLAMIYLKSDLELQSVFPTSGNIKSFNSLHVLPRNDSNQFELGTIDLKILEGFRQGIEFLKTLGKSKINQIRSDYRDKIIEMLNEIEGINILYLPQNQNDPCSHLSISTPSNVHDVALLLDEMANIEVRSGRICSHLAMEKFELDGVIRLSWHIYNEIEEIQIIKDTLTQVLTMTS